MDTKETTQELSLFPPTMVDQVVNELTDKIDTALEVINAPEAINKGVASLHYLLLLQGHTPETWPGPGDYETELAAALGAAAWSTQELSTL